MVFVQFIKVNYYIFKTASAPNHTSTHMSRPKLRHPLCRCVAVAPAQFISIWYWFKWAQILNYVPFSMLKHQLNCVWLHFFPFAWLRYLSFFVVFSHQTQYSIYICICIYYYPMLFMNVVIWLNYFCFNTRFAVLLCCL